MSTAAIALRSASEPRTPRALKTASREIFAKRGSASRRQRAYAFVASRENACIYEKSRQDRQSLQTDPVGYEDDLNLYAYIANDPLNLSDPTGRQQRPGSPLTEWPVPDYPYPNEADRHREGQPEFGTPRSEGTHGGLDIKAPEGTPVVAAGNGTVVAVAPNPSSTFGEQVAIDHGDGVFTVSAHLQEGSATVQPGDQVQSGDQIGQVGLTGNSPGDPHLHIEVRLGSVEPRVRGGHPVNPRGYLPVPPNPHAYCGTICRQTVE